MLALGNGFENVGAGFGLIVLLILFYAPFLLIGAPLSALILLGAAIEIVGYRRLMPKTRKLVRAVSIFGVVLTVVGCIPGMGLVITAPKDKLGWIIAISGPVVVGLSRFCLWRDSRVDSSL